MGRPRDVVCAGAGDAAVWAIFEAALLITRF
jgi:hypothetical protein